MFLSTNNFITIKFHSGTNAWNYEGFHLKWVDSGVGCEQHFELTDENHKGNLFYNKFNDLKMKEFKFSVLNYYFFLFNFLL